jgi:glyoxylase-like metal-dependent hydrolase (beta-lactamase superfamily II)
VASATVRAVSTAARRAPLDPRLADPVPRRPQDTRAHRLDDGLWTLQLALPYPNARAVNCYLLQGDDGWILIDCGSRVGDGWETLVTALGLAGVAPAAITTLLLTHHHTDHQTLAPRVVAELGCELVAFDAPPAARPAFTDPLLAPEERERIARREGVPAEDEEAVLRILLAGDGIDPPAVDRLLHAGDVVTARAGAWEVLPAPGHCCNMVLLAEAGSGRVLCADAVYPATPPFLEWGFTPDPVADYRATLDRLEALDPRLLLPGHGPPDDDAPARIAAGRRTLEAVERTTLAVVGDDPCSAYDVTVALVGDDPSPDTRQTTLSVTLALLEHHRDRGTLVEDIGKDGVRRFARAG